MWKFVNLQVADQDTSEPIAIHSSETPKETDRIDGVLEASSLDHAPADTQECEATTFNNGESHEHQDQSLV